MPPGVADTNSENRSSSAVSLHRKSTFISLLDELNEEQSPKKQPKEQKKKSKRERGGGALVPDSYDLEVKRREAERHKAAWEDLHQLRDELVYRYSSALDQKVKRQHTEIRKRQEREEAVAIERSKREEKEAHQLKKRLQRVELQHNDQFLRNMPKSDYYKMVQVESALEASGRLRCRQDRELLWKSCKDDPRQLQRLYTQLVARRTRSAPSNATQTTASVFSGGKVPLDAPVLNALPVSPANNFRQRIEYHNRLQKRRRLPPINAGKSDGSDQLKIEESAVNRALIGRVVERASDIPSVYLGDAKLHRDPDYKPPREPISKDSFKVDHLKNGRSVTEFARAAAVEMDRHYSAPVMPDLNCFKMKFGEDPIDPEELQKQVALRYQERERKQMQNKVTQMYQMAQTHYSTTQRLMDKHQADLDVVFNGPELNDIMPDTVTESSVSVVEDSPAEEHYRKWLRNRRIATIAEESEEEGERISRRSRLLESPEMLSDSDREPTPEPPPKDPLCMTDVIDTEHTKEAQCLSSMWHNYLRAGHSTWHREQTKGQLTSAQSDTESELDIQLESPRSNTEQSPSCE